MNDEFIFFVFTSKIELACLPCNLIIFQYLIVIFF